MTIGIAPPARPRMSGTLAVQTETECRNHVDNRSLPGFDGKTEAATRCGASLLPSSGIHRVRRLCAKTPASVVRTVLSVDFTLAGTTCIAWNGGSGHRFTMALFAQREDQAEANRPGQAPFDGGGAMGCGWSTHPLRATANRAPAL